MPRDRLFVLEMIDAAEQAQKLVAGRTLDELEHDRLLHDALLWNFTVLGEAAAKVSADLKQRYPDIPWRRPADTRNRIVHGYWTIDVEILYTATSSSRRSHEGAGGLLTVTGCRRRAARGRRRQGWPAGPG